MQEELYRHIKTFITPRRAGLIDKVAENRTRFIAVVLEDIYQPHNASAVLRTCDCFGIQDVHIIENKNRYRINPDVTLGSDKWLSIFRYSKRENNTANAIKKIREKGYRIVATVPGEKAINAGDYDLSPGKTALFFGTELNGLSETVLRNADAQVKIPMLGFTESFNISVSAAIIIYHLSNKLRESGIPWHLSPDELLALKIQWIKNSLKNGDLIEKEFITRFKPRQ